MARALLEEAPPNSAPAVLYWENMEGGHFGTADSTQQAYAAKLTYEFLAKALDLGRGAEDNARLQRGLPAKARL